MPSFAPDIQGFHRLLPLLSNVLKFYSPLSTYCILRIQDVRADNRMTASIITGLTQFFSQQLGILRKTPFLVFFSCKRILSVPCRASLADRLLRFLLKKERFHVLLF